MTNSAVLVLKPGPAPGGRRRGIVWWWCVYDGECKASGRLEGGGRWSISETMEKTGESGSEDERVGKAVR